MEQQQRQQPFSEKPIQLAVKPSIPGKNSENNNTFCYTILLTEIDRFAFTYK
jgi:hypothetical protein